MTNREFLTAVLGLENAPEEIVTYATEALEKMDSNASSRKVKEAEKRAEARAARLEDEAPILQAIMSTLTTEPKTAAQIIAEAGLEIKPQKLSMMLRPAFNDGVIEKEMIKGEKGKVTGYKLA